MNFQEFQDRFQKVQPQFYSYSQCANPLVSICVQTYNHENYISECLDSLLNQFTDFDYEIILGEDNSRDSTREICKKYAEKYPNIITLILHEDANKLKVNSQPTGNFNAVFNYYTCRGKFIAFCEGDDYWTDENKLQQQVDFLKVNPDYAFCFHKFKTVNLEGSPKELLEQPIQDIPERDLIENNTHHPLLSTICFRNNFMQLPFQVVEVLNVDTFLLSLLGQRGAAKYLNGISPSIYRIHNSGIWSNRWAAQKYISKINTYRKMKDYYSSINNHSVASVFNNKVKQYRKHLIYNLLKNGEVKALFRNLINQDNTLS
jgi:glycosyltransferase involved in cell wall biosynthesis